MQRQGQQPPPPHYLLPDHCNLLPTVLDSMAASPLVYCLLAQPDPPSAPILDPISISIKSKFFKPASASLFTSRHLPPNQAFLVCSQLSSISDIRPVYPPPSPPHHFHCTTCFSFLPRASSYPSDLHSYVITSANHVNQTSTSDSPSSLVL